MTKIISNIRGIIQAYVVASTNYQIAKSSKKTYINSYRKFHYLTTEKYDSGLWKMSYHCKAQQIISTFIFDTFESRKESLARTTPFLVHIYHWTIQNTRAVLAGFAFVNPTWVKFIQIYNRKSGWILNQICNSVKTAQGKNYERLICTHISHTAELLLN